MCCHICGLFDYFSCHNLKVINLYREGKSHIFIHISPSQNQNFSVHFTAGGLRMFASSFLLRQISFPYQPYPETSESVCIKSHTLFFYSTGCFDASGERSAPTIFDFGHENYTQSFQEVSESTGRTRSGRSHLGGSHAFARHNTTISWTAHTFRRRLRRYKCVCPQP